MVEKQNRKYIIDHTNPEKEKRQNKNMSFIASLLSRSSSFSSCSFSKLFFQYHPHIYQHIILLIICIILHITVVSTRNVTFTLDPSNYLEGEWQNGPLIPASNRFNQRNKAAYTWRSSTLRHPYVEFPTVKGFPMDSITIGVWIKIDINDPGGCVFDISCDNCVDRCPASIRLMSTRQGAHVFLIPTKHEANEGLCGLRAQRPRVVNTITALNIGEWRHVAVVLDATKQIFQLYVDGKLDGFVEGAVRYEAIARRQVKNIILGRQYQDLANPINAAYDDLQLWDKALSKTEIENLAKINCEFTDWSEWSSCENAAKKGNNIDDNVFAIRRRTRKITLTPKNGGIKCPTKLLEEENCRIMTSL